MLAREMAEAEGVDERMKGNEQMAWMGAEDGDDSRQGRGCCARGNHGISEERNGSRAGWLSDDCKKDWKGIAVLS